MPKIFLIRAGLQQQQQELLGQVKQGDLVPAPCRSQEADQDQDWTNTVTQRMDSEDTKFINGKNFTLLTQTSSTFKALFSFTFTTICDLTDSLSKCLYEWLKSNISLCSKDDISQSLHCTVEASVSMFLYQIVSAKVRHSATRPHRHCHCLQKQSASPHSRSRGAKETLPRAIVMLRPDMSGQKGFFL